MGSENVKEFTDANFEAEVVGATQPVLVDFWAEWCMPCKMLAPEIDSLADELAGKAKIGKVDIEANPNIPMQFGITAIPTIIVFQGGKPMKRFVGMKKKAELLAALQEAGVQ